MLASQDGKIVLENTLDARLDVVFRKKLPEVCSNSFTASLVTLYRNFILKIHKNGIASF